MEKLKKRENTYHTNSRLHIRWARWEYGCACGVTDAYDYSDVTRIFLCILLHFVWHRVHRRTNATHHEKTKADAYRRRQTIAARSCNEKLKWSNLINSFSTFFFVVKCIGRAEALAPLLHRIDLGKQEKSNTRFFFLLATQSRLKH